MELKWQIKRNAMMEICYQEMDAVISVKLNLDLRAHLTGSISPIYAFSLAIIQHARLAFPLLTGEIHDVLSAFRGNNF
jgi:hypothetical protein